MKNASFSEKESYCQFLFDQNAPFWHIATPGSLTEILFTCPEDFRFGMSQIAICAIECKLHTYAFQLMSNHLHLITGAPDARVCRVFLDRLASRLSRFFSGKGRPADLSAFVCDPFPIESLQSLRNSIVYTHRNGYVADSSQTPYSYMWGSGGLYFGESITSLKAVKYSDLTVKDRRLLTCSRTVMLPDETTVRNGCISPESFCDWKTGINLFRDAHQYFNMLTKNYEAYAEFAALLGESIVLTDEEMYAAACSLSRKQFNVGNPRDLSEGAKTDLARRLHYDYHAGNNQIRRLLRLEQSVVDSLFPSSW